MCHQFFKNFESGFSWWFTKTKTLALKLWPWNPNPETLTLKHLPWNLLQWFHISLKHLAISPAKNKNLETQKVSRGIISRHLDFLASKRREWQDRPRVSTYPTRYYLIDFSCLKNGIFVIFIKKSWISKFDKIIAFEVFIFSPSNTQKMEYIVSGDI